MTEPTQFALEPQASQVYAIFDNPPIVFAGLVNQTFTTHDMVVEFGFDGVTTGAYTAVLPGMTILLGSTAGASDLGMTYARKAPTSSKVYVGETSEVTWADNIHFTVIQDWGIWIEYPVVLSDGTALMKRDIVYSDQHTNMTPVPIVGGDRVAKLTGATVSLAFDGSGSYVYGSTISAHLFTCAGATVTNGTTATPSISFASYGRYVVVYKVTAANGKSTTTYRIVQIWDDAHPPSNVIAGSISGSFERGGWEFGIDVLDPSASIRQRTRVFLFAEDYYGTTKASYGPLAGSENIVAMGWLENEAVALDIKGGQLQFAVKCTQYWLAQLYDFVPLGIQAVSATPVAWTQMKNLTVDKMLWHMLQWRTTVLNCVDVTLTGYTREALELSAQPGSLWDQIKAISWNSILASPCCDRYGRLFVETEIALHPVSLRSGFPVTSTITKDSCEAIQAQRVTVTPASQVILSGVAVTGMVGQAIFALSRGHIPMRYGHPVTMERLLLSTQALSNELAANLLERENAPYKFSFQNLLANNRLVDLCPRQYVSATIAAADNLRGIAYSGNVIVKTISLELSSGGAWDITWEAVPETSAVLSVNGDIPTSVLQGGDVVPGDGWTPPTLPPPPPPPPGVPPIIPSIPPGSCGFYAPTNDFVLSWSKSVITGADTDRIASVAFPCTLRPASYYNGGTVIGIDIAYHGDAITKTHVYGMLGGTRIITGNLATPSSGSGTTWVTFPNVSELAVDGFEMELEAGGIDPSGSGNAITLNSKSTSSIVNTGSVTFNLFTATQVNANTIRGDFDVTVVDGSSLVLNQFNLTINLTNAATVSFWMTVYFTASPNYARWHAEPPGAGTEHWGNLGGVAVPMGTYGPQTGNFSLKVKDGYQFDPISVENFVGTLRYTGRFYITSYSTTLPVPRSINIGASRIYNVCA